MFFIRVVHSGRDWLDFADPSVSRHIYQDRNESSVRNNDKELLFDAPRLFEGERNRFHEPTVMEAERNVQQADDVAKIPTCGNQRHTARMNSNRHR
jgi:hypothetical protein